MHKFEKLNTPCYIIDSNKYKSNIDLFKKHFTVLMKGKQPILGYSVKTNHNIELIKIALECGMLAEVVSDDEYNLALGCGCAADNIIFNGPQKSEELLIWSLKNGSIVNLDNFEEIAVIKKHINEFNKDALKIGLRVNFNLEANCPGETTAGTEVSRFGFCLENGDFEKAVKDLGKVGVHVQGVHMHYSSKSRSTAIYRELAYMAGELISKYMSDLNQIFIDIGGGFFLGKDEITLGKPTVEEYAVTIIEEIKKNVSLDKVHLIIEPGAALLATPISYLTKVINTRDVRGTKVVTMDGTILHINPFMAHREPSAACIYKDSKGQMLEEQIICGATCMENDRFIKLKDAKEMEVGDYLHCFNVGAYTMGFNSCFINLPPYIYVQENGKYRMIRDKNDRLMQRI